MPAREDATRSALTTNPRRELILFSIYVPRPKASRIAENTFDHTFSALRPLPHTDFTLSFATPSSRPFLISPQSAPILPITTNNNNNNHCMSEDRSKFYPFSSDERTSRFPRFRSTTAAHQLSSRADSANDGSSISFGYRITPTIVSGISRYGYFAGTVNHGHTEASRTTLHRPLSPLQKSAKVFRFPAKPDFLCDHTNVSKLRDEHA